MHTRVGVLGDGAWGTAIALLLARQTNVAVTLWSARPENGEALKAHRENRRFLPGVPIPETIGLTTDPAEVVHDAHWWVIAIPTVHLRSTLGRFRELASQQAPIVSLTKGIEIGSFRRPSEIIAEVLGHDHVVALSGPSHAEEVCRGMPTSVVAASADSALAASAQALFNSDRFRVYTNSDLIGVELAGALKNVMGLAAGMSDGLGFGDNAKSALLTRSLVEMTRFGMALGAEPDTFHGLAGMGDLIATCFSQHGRNRRVGEALGRGQSLADILASSPAVVEGVTTAKSVHERVLQMGLEMPIVAAVHAVLYAGVPPAAAVAQLMARRSRSERTSLSDLMPIIG